MKISELVAELEVLWADHGDIEVQSTYSCGCCVWEDDPSPKIEVPDQYEIKEGNVYEPYVLLN